MEFGTGDLVHIPAKTTVFKERSDGSYYELAKLNRPSLGLVVKRLSYPYYLVTIEGVSWNIHKNDIYHAVETKGKERR